MTRPVVAALQLLVAVMNIPTKVGPKNWDTCFRRLASHGEIFGINEAGSWRAKRLYRTLAKQLGYAHYGLSGPNPVFWKASEYRRVSSRTIKLHARAKGALARRWPGFNGARYLTVVVLAHRGTGEFITVLNWHMVAPGRKVRARWRERMRARSIARIRRLVAYHLSVDRIVLGMGDANRDAFVIDRFTWIHDDGPDLMGIGLPKGVYLERADDNEFAAPTDHKHGKSAVIDLIGAAA